MLDVQGDDPELEAIRQRRMQQLMGQYGGGQVGAMTALATLHVSLLWPCGVHLRP